MSPHSRGATAPESCTFFRPREQRAQGLPQRDPSGVFADPSQGTLNGWSEAETVLSPSILAPAVPSAAVKADVAQGAVVQFDDAGELAAIAKISPDGIEK